MAAEIPLGPFREAFARSGLTITEVAYRGGLEHTHATRLVTERTAFCRKNGKRYGPYPYRNCSYETAAKLARGLDLDPFEVGL